MSPESSARAPATRRQCTTGAINAKRRRWSPVMAFTGITSPTVGRAATGRPSSVGPFIFRLSFRLQANQTGLHQTTRSARSGCILFERAAASADRERVRRIHPDPCLPFVPICAGPCLLLLPETGLCVQTGRAGSSENAHGLATVTSVSHTSSLEAPSFQDLSDTRADRDHRR